MCVITAAGQGIGRATAELFFNEGAIVYARYAQFLFRVGKIRVINLVILMQKPWNNSQKVLIQLFLMWRTQQPSKNTALSCQKLMFYSMLPDGFHTDLFLTRVKKNGTNVWIWTSRVCLEWNGFIRLNYILPKYIIFIFQFWNTSDWHVKLKWPLKGSRSSSINAGSRIRINH